MAYLYRHIRLDKNKPFYIGICSTNNYSRAYRKTYRNPIWNRIVLKTEYEVEIVLENLTWDEACKKETEFIALYGRIDINTGILSNMTDGGEGTPNKILTFETKLKIGKGNKGKVLSKEHREKIGENNRIIGATNTNVKRLVFI